MGSALLIALEDERDYAVYAASQVMTQEPLAELSATACVESLRSIERGLNRPPYPCLICSPDDQYGAIIARYPQTLHLKVPNSPQAASVVAAGILQMIHTLQAYQTSAESSRTLASQLSLATQNIELGGHS